METVAVYQVLRVTEDKYDVYIISRENAYFYIDAGWQGIGSLPDSMFTNYDASGHQRMVDRNLIVISRT